MPTSSTKDRMEWLLFRKWDSEAAGVPRRFGMNVMFMMMTMYALLFALMRMMNTHPGVFAVIAIFVTGVGASQMILFGGKYPRAASIWSGAILLPIELFVATGVFAYSDSGQVGLSIIAACVATILGIPLGALSGYLSGGLTAGAFLLIELSGHNEQLIDDQFLSDAKLEPENESPNNSK